MINMALIDCFSNVSCRDLVYFYDFNLLKQLLSNYLLMLNSDLPSVKKNVYVYFAFVSKSIQNKK